MKRKISGLLSIGIILAAVGAAYIYYGSEFWRVREPLQMRAVQPLASIWVPDQSTVKEMKRLERRMAQLVHPSGSDTRPVDLMLFGYHSTDAPRQASGARGPKLPIDMDYALSFAFVSKRQRVCMIDSMFYGQGDELPDGARILKIEPKRVLIQKKRFKKWLETKDMKDRVEKEALKNQPTKNKPS